MAAMRVTAHSTRMQTTMWWATTLGVQKGSAKEKQCLSIACCKDGTSFEAMLGKRIRMWRSERHAGWVT